MTTQDIKVRIGLEGADQVQAGATRAGAALGALDGNARKFGQAAAISGQQTAQLSAQLQDFAIQVQGGANPLTAFLQQGSQLSAVFGGAGNALRAVTSLITPTVAAFGAAAAAIGTVGFAYAKGEAERMAFERGLVTTGNAAGVTAGQLVELAKAASAYGSTRGEASDVLAQLVASGRVAGTVLGQAAEAAVRLERAGVASVKETVAAFSELGKSPLQALLRLNETQNFLTESTYRQVRALQEQGRQSEAARVAQEAYAAEATARARELESRLGYLASAWKTVREQAAKAWDAILDIGRTRTPEERLADVELALQANARRTDRADSFGLNGKREGGDAQRARLQQQAEELRLQIYQQGELAAATASRAESLKRTIEADEKAASAVNKHTDALRRQAEAQIAAGVAQARGGTLEEAGFSANFLDRYRELQAALRAGAISAGEFEQAQARLIKQQPVMVRQQAELAKVIKEADAARERELKGMLASADAAEKQVQTLRDQYIELTAGKAALQDYADMRLEDAAAAAEQRLQVLQLVNASTEELAAAQRNAQALREQIELRKQIATATGNNELAEARRKADEADATARQRLYDDYREGLTEAFRAAFAKGGDFGRNFVQGLEVELKSRLATALAEIFGTQVLGALLGSAITGAAGAAGGAGGTNWLNLASNASSAYSMYSGGGLFGQVGRSVLNTSVGSSLWYGSGAGLAQGGGAAAGIGGSSAGAILGDAGGTVAANAVGSGSLGAGASVGSWGSWLSTWGALIVAGIYKANDDWKQGFRRDQARDVSETFWGGFGLLGDLQPMGGLEQAKANFLSQLGFSDKWADLLSGATAVSALFGRSAPKVDQTGIRGTLGSGGFEGQAFADIVEKGGLFRSDKRYTETAAISQELDRFLDGGTKALLEGARAYGEALGLPVDALATVQKDVQVIFGESAEENQKALLDAISGYGDALVAQWAEAVAPLATYNESTVDTITRVAGAIGTVNQVLETLGLTALEASIAGGQAAVDLQALFGDLATFQQAAGGYLQNYYTEAERTDLSLKSIGEQLAAVGIAVPSTRDAFRDLVEAQDLSTQAGRDAFTVLMGVADAFAAVTSAGRSAADIAREAQQIQLDTWRAMGNDQALRDFQRSQIDPSNLPAYDNLQAFLAQQEEAARLAAEKAAADAEAARLQKEADAAAEAARQAAYQASTAFWAAQEAAAARVQAAWVPVWQSIGEQIGLLRGEPASGQTLADLQAQFAVTTAAARAGDAGAGGQLAGLAKNLVDFAKDMSTTAAQWALFRAQTAASLEETLRITGGGAFVPRFASGGLHSGGVRLVGEMGPELAVTGPERIYSFDQLMDMARGGAGGDAALQGEILAKLGELGRLLQAVQQNTGDTYGELRRVIEDGAIRTRADDA